MRPSAIRVLCLTLLVVVPTLDAQGKREDYERANALGTRWGGKLLRFRPAFQWLPGDKAVWWKDDSAPKSKRFIKVDTATGKRRVGATAAALGLREVRMRLPARSSWGRSQRTGRKTSILFENRLRRIVRLFWSDRQGRVKPYGSLAPGSKRTQPTRAGHVWLLDYSANDLCGIFIATSAPGHAVIDAASRALTTRGAGERASAAGYRTQVESDNVVGFARDGDRFRLTKDGTAAHPYRKPQWWSPDGTRVLGMRVKVGERRQVPLIESSPNDRVQPRLTHIQYAKPGDRRDQPVPRIYDLKKRAVIEVDGSRFRDAFSVNKVSWSTDGSRVFVVYNRRGHQELSLLSIDARTGEVSDVVKETSETFVDYSQKFTLRWLRGGRELLWASERDGFNHLYRFDASGKLINRVTSGAWVVRSVERVDAAKKRVWFTAMGIVPGQDPYHRHLARVDLDGRNLSVLTEGDGTHKWSFSPGRRFFVDSWSRVDRPEVTELRRASDGSLVARLGGDDVSKLSKAGYKSPERFVAKGRDGKTDIHGILIRPSNFDTRRRYPVIEAIYAGPHGHHVPKTFGVRLRQRVLAELGFVVVQIDGMGTNWRSKAFHDVCWRNLKDGGFPDRIAWMRAAARKYPELDLDRVGIFGGSAGGQNALAALLHHGDFYKAGVADCGCHDNRMDKIWWNEAWMGVMGPHYAANSNVTHAGKLTGQLLLTWGELDKNVDPASSMQVVDALIRANKDFEMLVVPGAGHGVGERPYLVRRRQDFFVRALLSVKPRR